MIVVAQSSHIDAASNVRKGYGFIRAFEATEG
jgi:hypothetical protein